MIRTPPQHNTTHPPGQFSGAPISPAKTLADQLERHYKYEPKRLSFEEWLITQDEETQKKRVFAYYVWTCAQSNK